MQITWKMQQLERIHQVLVIEKNRMESSLHAMMLVIEKKKMSIDQCISYQQSYEKQLDLSNSLSIITIKQINLFINYMEKLIQTEKNEVEIYNSRHLELNKKYSEILLKIEYFEGIIDNMTREKRRVIEKREYEEVIEHKLRKR